LGGGWGRAWQRHVGVSTRNQRDKPPTEPIRPRPRGIGPLRDPLDELALVASSKREMILRAHRFRLRREDLEDCFGQAVLELTVQVTRGERFAGRDHLANVLEQRVLSRIHDRRRALAGRSPIQAALEGAWSLGEHGETEIQIVDRRCQVEELVILRQQLRRIEAVARRLTPDQRLVLASQVAGTGRADFCEIHGWSGEKYRKVAQRARMRLRQLIGEEEVAVPPASQASDGKPGTNQ